jgi:hypothetical protein
VDLIFFRLWNFKKRVQKIGCKKQGAKSRVQKVGCKKQGHCYSKREGVAWPLLFLNNNDPVFCTCHSDREDAAWPLLFFNNNVPVFCTLLFAAHILDLFL